MIRVIHFVNMKKRRILGTYGTFKKQQVPTFTLSLIIFAITYFREFPEFWSISQDQINAKFSLKQHSRKKIHTRYVKKITFRENKFTEKNIHKKCWLIRLFFQNASVTTIFSSSPACLSVDRGRNNSQMSLDSIAFF